MNTSLKALNLDADIFNMLFSADPSLAKGQGDQFTEFAELFNSQLTSKFDGVDSISNIEPQVILDAIQQLVLTVSPTFNLTQDQVATLNQSLLLAASASEAKAVETPAATDLEAPVANLQQNSVSGTEEDASLSLDTDLPNNGDNSTIVDESQAEEDLMDTTVVTAPPKNQTVNVFVPDTSTNTDGPSFGQFLQQQTVKQSNLTAQQNSNTDSQADDDIDDNNITSDAVTTLSNNPSKNTQQADKQNSEDTLVDTQSADKPKTDDAVDHAIMLAQLMRPSELPADQLNTQSAIKKVAVQDISTTQKNTTADKIAPNIDTGITADKDLHIDANKQIATKADAGKLALTDTEHPKTSDIALNQFNIKDSNNTKIDVNAKANQQDASTKVDSDKAVFTARNDNNQNGGNSTNNQQFGNSNQDSNQLLSTANTTAQATDSNKSVPSQFSPLLAVNNSGTTLNGLSTATNTVYSQNINTPVGYQNWDQALGQRVGMMISNGNQSATLTLNPPELGPLQITVHMQSHGVADATFVTAHAEVKQAIEAAIPKLREMLDQSGIQLGQANINSQTNQQNSQQGQYSQGSTFYRYAAQGDDSEVNEQTVPLMQRVVSQGQGAVDTFA